MLKRCNVYMHTHRPECRVVCVSRLLGYCAESDFHCKGIGSFVRVLFAQSKHNTVLTEMYALTMEASEITAGRVSSANELRAKVKQQALE